jgi:integrase/recombinase XerC/integrase/recombinase XerD
MKTEVEIVPNSGEIVGTNTELIQVFIADQDVKPSSLATYKRTLKRFFDYVERQGLQMKSIQLPDLIQYKNFLLRPIAEGGSGKKPLTVSSYIVVLKKFYSWTESRKLYPNIAKGLKTPKKDQGFKKQPLTVDQIQELLSSINRNDLQGKRDFALLNLLLRTGLRTVEAVRADLQDVDFLSGQRVLFVHGKGKEGKDSFVILTDKAFQPIADYLQARRDFLRERGRTLSSDCPLFAGLGNRNLEGRLTTRSLSRIAKTYLRGIDIDSPQYTAHSFRHTAGVNVLKAGGSLYDTQLFMRHTDPKTTQIYLKTIEQERRLQEAPEKRLDSIF